MMGWHMFRIEPGVVLEESHGPQGPFSRFLPVSSHMITIEMSQQLR